jgi:hypothetical protein
MKYLDFELSVDSRGQSEYEVSARSPNGQARTQIRFPFEPAELERHRSALGSAIELSRGERDGAGAQAESSHKQQMDSVRAFGQALFASLLGGKVLTAYRASAAMAAQEGKGLRLQLRVQAPEMAALPWEFMFDPDQGSFVCLDPDTPLVRYPELDQAEKPLTVRWPLRILAMVASPCDLPQLDKDGERSRIERALEELLQDGSVELHWVDGGTYSDLQEAMHRGPWHIFHFIGHGGFDEQSTGGSGTLALESTPTMESAIPKAGELTDLFAGRAHFVPADVVGHPSLRLVLLNSCLGARSSTTDLFSSTAATLVRRGIPAVVAMQYAITDQAALAFSKAFYSSLAAATPVDRAVVDARTAIRARRTDSIEWATPVLLMRSPTGDLFPPAPANWFTGLGTLLSRVSTPRRLMVALAALALPALAAALLALFHLPQVDIGLDAKVSRVGLMLPAPQPLGEQVAVSMVGASGLSGVALPASVAASGEGDVDRVLITALDEGRRRGRLTLDLTTIMPAGTRVALATSSEAGAYELSLSDSIPEVAVGVVGPVRVTLPGTLNQRVNFAAPAVIRLHPGPGVLGLDFRPIDSTPTQFGDRIRTSALELIRIDRYESPQGTMIREVSTIRSGVLLVNEMGSRRELESEEEIRLGGLSQGLARLELGGDHVGVSARARVEGLTSGAANARRDLKPSVLSWILARHSWPLAGGATLYLTVLLLLLTRSKRRPE